MKYFLFLFMLLTVQNQYLFAQKTQNNKSKINLSKEIKKRGQELNKKRATERNTAKQITKNQVQQSTVKDAYAKFSKRKLKRIGDKQASRGNLYNAIKYFKTALYRSKKRRHKFIFNKKIADANFKLRNYSQAKNYYSKAIQYNKKPKKYPLLEFQLANSYKYLAEYDTAIALYKTFLKAQSENDKLKRERRRARLEVKGAALGQNIRQKDDGFVVENLGENVNGAFSDYGAAWQNNTLYFSKVYLEKETESTEKQFSKIYYSQLNKDKFEYFQDFASSVNLSKQHIGNPSFTQDGNTVYFTSCGTDEENPSYCKIMRSKRENNVWQEPISLNKNINKENTNTTHPQITQSPDGKTILFFVSNRKGSKGGLDIWLSEADEEGDFQRAKRVKTPVNTSFDEITPFYHQASNTLYFSSNGHPSIGGFDVFKLSHFFEQNASDDEYEIEHLGLPVNSSVDDYDFIFNENEDVGFFTSNRKGHALAKSETCCYDIFMLKNTIVNLYVKGTVFADNNSSRLKYQKADLFLYNNKTGERIENVLSKDKAGYFAKIDVDKEYKLVAVSDEFENETITFSTQGIKKSDTLQYDIFLKERNLIGHTIAKVHYTYGQSKLKEGSLDTLRKVIHFMNAYPKTIVEVASHTDSKGTEEYNLKLSEKRSIAVKNYLIYQGGIASKRLVNKWYGESKPIRPNTKPDGTDNPEGRNNNRRTEFIVIDQLTQE